MIAISDTSPWVPVEILTYQWEKGGIVSIQRFGCPNISFLKSCWVFIISLENSCKDLSSVNAPQSHYWEAKVHWEIA